MKAKKTIALVAHDNQKKDLVEWAKYNAEKLMTHDLVCTGTTGGLLSEMFKKNFPDKKINMKLLKSGPLGGDQQLGAMITDGLVDILIFLTDPMTPQPHDVDVKALWRISVIYDIALACNLTSADFLLNSIHFDKAYEQRILDFSVHTGRFKGEK